METQENNTENIVNEAQNIEIQPEKKPIITTPMAIVSGALFIALALLIVGANKSNNAANLNQKQAQNQQQDAMPTSVSPDVVKVRPTDYVRGDKNASVVVFEYTDSDCYYCGKFHPTMQQVLTEYKGKVAWVYRMFPINSLHPNANTEAQALLCVGKLAGNNAFWDYADTIMNTTFNNDPKSNLPLYTYAEGLGISKNTMTTCMADKNIAKQVDDSVLEAQSIGAQGTPFSVAVNTKTGKQVVIPGAYPIEEVRKMIDSVLK